jgi:hypothetical protein
MPRKSPTREGDAAGLDLLEVVERDSQRRDDIMNVGHLRRIGR